MTTKTVSPTVPSPKYTIGASAPSTVTVEPPIGAASAVTTDRVRINQNAGTVKLLDGKWTVRCSLEASNTYASPNLVLANGNGDPTLKAYGAYGSGGIGALQLGRVELGSGPAPGEFVVTGPSHTEFKVANGQVNIVGSSFIGWTTAGGRSFLIDAATGKATFFNSAGHESVVVDGTAGDIILGGGDCAEEFLTHDGQVEPGMVVVSKGERLVAACDRDADPAVVGVVSGANGLAPGVVLHRRAREDGAGASLPIAMCGTVYCKADTQYGPILPGDLLVTSSNRGHARKAPSRPRRGTILGKSLGSLSAGSGYVLVLVGTL